jgi:hypothetical protein
MELRIAEATENYPIIRFLSEQDVWELGIYPVMYGYRVSCNRVASLSYLKGGYCAGADMGDVFKILLYLHDILEGQSESVTERTMNKVLPDWTKRPIPERDPDCMRQLAALAMRSPLKSAQ